MSAKAATQVTLLGSTGLVGSSALRYMLSSSNYAYSLTTITRSTPHTVSCANASTTHSNRAVSDIAEAVKGSVGSPGGVYITALGTTRRKAGGVAAQRAIDVDLNKQLAAKAREDGSTYVILVSSAGADAKSSGAYPQMKGELEESIKGMGFEKTVILRPGFLLGDRPGISMGEAFGQKLFYGFRRVGLPVKGVCIDSDDVGAAIAYLVHHPPTESVSTIVNTEIAALAQQWRGDA